MSLVTRFRDDDPAPRLRAVARDLVFRALVPALGLIVLGLAVGWLVVVPLSASTGEDQLNQWLRAGRTPALDTVARVASEIGSVTGNAVICVLSVALLWIFSRKWWLAALPAIALQLHILVHIITSTLVSRPRPDIEPLDIGQPTASFPSGHMGATTAQLLVVILFLCHRVKNLAVRVAAIALTTIYLLCLGWSRLYLGMHHLSDVVWGALNGIVCGLIAWLFLRRDPAGAAAHVETSPGADAAGAPGGGRAVAGDA